MKKSRRVSKALSIPYGRGGTRVLESFSGAWQQNVEVVFNDVMAHDAVFACITLIASDIAKLPLRLVSLNDGIWEPASSNAFTPVLKKPNHFQTRIEFIQQWMVSKLAHGNAYVLKQRDQRGVVTRLYVLDPRGVTPLVSDSGEVYYRLATDRLSRLEDEVTIPASEIIHDKYNPLYHPLIGVSPIYACGLAATQGLAIQKNATKFFGNQSQPGGVLTAPSLINDETAARLKSHWEANYSGDNAGKVAVLGDGLKFESMAFKAADSQMSEMGKDSTIRICSAFHVPPYKIGAGDLPSYNNAEILNQIYYADCLQILIESVELCLDEGLGLDTTKDGFLYGTEFDIDQLSRMDTATKVKANVDLVGAGIKSPNEGRLAFNLRGVTGGQSPHVQQQNYSLEALARRDEGDDPFGTKKESPIRELAMKLRSMPAIEYA